MESRKTGSGLIFTYDANPGKLTDGEKKTRLGHFAAFQESVLQPYKGKKEWNNFYPKLNPVMANLVADYAVGKLDFNLSELKKYNINEIIRTFNEINDFVKSKSQDPNVYTKKAKHNTNTPVFE